LESKLKRPRLAERAYQLANKLTPDRATVLFRLGRVRERRKDWTGAERAYSAGISLQPSNVDTFLARRADVLERLGRWREAISDCTATPGVVPPARLVPRLAEELRRDGELPEAASIFERAARKRPTSKAWVAVAECRTELGDLKGAVDAYATAVELAPDNLTVRTSHGRTAGLRSLVPFEIIDGVPQPVPSEVGKDALSEATADLEHVMLASETRVWTAYWLGRILESHRLLADARHAYETAVTRARAVDKPWAHHAHKAWQFRRTYVDHRISGELSDDARVNRVVVPGPSVHGMSDSAGYFEASITNNGLLVEGFVLHGHTGSIELFLNGMRILRLAGNEGAWNRDFKTTIVHNVVGAFPPRSELSLRVGDSHLCTINGARSVDVVVPDGRGELEELFSAGHVLTKKGRWADPVATSGSRDDTYLSAYAKAKQFLDTELGIKLFLSYGTLLGCYRDGHLIPGDDDFDVSFVTEATDPDSLKVEVIEVIKSLLRGGFDSRVAVDGRMFHLRVDDVVLDVNPFWFHRRRAWSFDAHDLTRDVFDPAATLTVHGVQVYVPNQTEAFLAENYGPDWQTPRSDFQYHRLKADQTVLRKARLVPSEVAALTDYSDELRAKNPRAGRFHGYGDPANPQFD
jgi:tetratricopeptide (TPR) repeat protein